MSTQNEKHARCIFRENAAPIEPKIELSYDYSKDAERGERLYRLGSIFRGVIAVAAIFCMIAAWQVSARLIISAVVGGGLALFYWLRNDDPLEPPPLRRF